MKRFLKVLLMSTIVLLGGFALASCGKKADIIFWHTFSKSSQAVLNSLLKDFEKETGITVAANAKGGYTDIRDKNSSAIAASTTPNLSVCYPDHVAKFNSGRNKPVVDLTKVKGFYTAEELKQFYPVFVQEGQQYTEPGMFSFAFAKSTEVMYYNKTFFDDNQLTVPQTWDDAKQVAGRIKSILSSKNTEFKGVIGYDSSANLFISSAAETNGPYTELVQEGKVKKGEITFSKTPQNKPDIDFIRFFNNLYQDKLFFTKKELESKAYTSTSFVSEKSFMSISSTGGVAYNEPNKNTKGKDKHTFKVGVARVPYFGTEGKYMLQGPSLCVFNHGSEANEKAVKLLRYLTGAEFQAKWATKTGYAPIRKDSLQTQTYKDYMSKDLTNPVDVLTRDTIKLFEEIASANQFVTSPIFKRSSNARDEVDKVFHNVFTDKEVIKDYTDLQAKTITEEQYNTKVDAIIQKALTDAYAAANS